MKAVHLLGLGFVVTATIGVASMGFAQSGSFDHLECYAIKDTLGRATATADVVPEAPPFLAAFGCKIKLPAREYCTRASKENLQPPPAATVGADVPGDYFCYKLACPRGADLRGAAIESEDQLGRRTFFVRKPQRLCMPASRPTPAPIVTPTPVGNQTGPTPTLTAGNPHDPGCFFDGTECQGPCNTTGRCVWQPSQQRCICPAVFDTDCNHAIVSCGGGLCFGPAQVCRPNPQSTSQLCACVAPTPTPVPTP